MIAFTLSYVPFPTLSYVPFPSTKRETARKGGHRARKGGHSTKRGTYKHEKGDKHERGTYANRHLYEAERKKGDIRKSTSVRGGSSDYDNCRTRKGGQTRKGGHSANRHLYEADLQTMTTVDSRYVAFSVLCPPFSVCPPFPSPGLCVNRSGCQTSTRSRNACLTCSEGASLGKPSVANAAEMDACDGTGFLAYEFDWLPNSGEKSDLQP